MSEVVHMNADDEVVKVGVDLASGDDRQIERVIHNSMSLCSCGSRSMTRVFLPSIANGVWRWRCDECHRQYEAITPVPTTTEDEQTVFELNALPLPVIHTDFVLNIKDLDQARRDKESQK